LRHRIWHLEHDLRDITARCHAERERRMSLEALVGGKNFHLYLIPCLSLDLRFLTTALLPYMSPTGTVT
jgi:hypothetical protein